MRLTTPRAVLTSVGVSFFLAVSGVALAAPAPAVSPTPKPHRDRASNASGASAPETALVYDDAYRPPAKDLLLTLDADRKAEAAARFMHGLILEETSDSDQAEAEYFRALNLDPGNAELSVRVAWDDLRRGDTAGAINLLKDTVKAAPRQSQPYIALAYLYFNNLNKPDLAQKYVQQALDIDPGNILAYEYLKEIYKASGQSAKVPALLDRALKTDSKDANYWLHLGELYVEAYTMDNPPGKGGDDDLKKATPVFQKALANGYDDVEIVNRVADFYVATKQIKEAAPLYQRVIDLDPSQNAARENLARCYRDTGEPQKAADVLEELIRLNPVQPRAYEVLAKIYEDAGQYDKALADYEQSLLVSPGDITGYENVAVLLLERFKQPEKAIPVLLEARRRFSNPPRPGFAYLLALALEEDKQHQQALLTFEQAEAEAQDGAQELLTSQFYFRYGATAEQAGLYDKAADLMKKSLSLDDNPTNIAETCNYLGYMWVDHGLHVEEAGDLIRRAVEIEPDNGMFVDSLGWFYYHTSKYDQALVQLARAVDLIKPEDPTVLEHLGDTYLKLNDTAKALDCWQRALGLDPANPNIPQLNKKIAEAKTPPPKG